MAKSKRPEINDNNLAIAYYRYSSHSQNEMSIDQQRQQAHAYADAHGLTIVKEYEDAAKTGTNANRPGYQQMLAEVGKLRPNALILWKTDRLGRDRFELVDAKRRIREAGCKLELIAEMSPTDDPESVLFEGIAESFAEYYSRTLSVNIKRGMDYNAEHGLYNGHAVFGYVGRPHEPYSVDEKAAGAVRKMFADYAAGSSMQEVCDELNAAGFRTCRGGKFGVKTMNRMLKNRRYVGEYSEGGVVIPDGMPRLIDDETFQAVQTRLLENRRKGKSKEQAARYWLSGKLYCGRCGAPVTGVSGTSKTGKVYGYYYCANARKHACGLRKMRRESIESLVGELLRFLLTDSELVASLAVDAAAYYAEHYGDGAYLDGLRGQLADVDKQLANVVKAVMAGASGETITTALAELEARKEGLRGAIDVEEAKQALADDAHSIQTYFSRYWRASVGDGEIRQHALDYLVERLVVNDDGLDVVGWLSERRDKPSSFDWEMLSGIAEHDPFAAREAALGFDRFPSGSTIRKPPEMTAFFVLPTVSTYLSACMIHRKSLRFTALHSKTWATHGHNIQSPAHADVPHPVILDDDASGHPYEHEGGYRNHNRYQERYHSVSIVLLDLEGHDEDGDEADDGAEQMIRRVSKHLDYVGDSKKRLNGVAQTQDHTAEHVLPVDVVGDESAGQRKERGRTPDGAVVVQRLVNGKAEHHLDDEAEWLADKKEDEDFERRLPAFRAVGRDDDREDDPPFVGNRDVLERCSLRGRDGSDDAGVGTRNDREQYHGKPTHLEASKKFPHPENPFSPAPVLNTAIPYEYGSSAGVSIASG
ncbi:recombinase family protein [Bifidobacterium dentium]|uniref:recombinase family protein n=1 Tax=Bifidobacterium dentium TaxID=1689 RepID=UPI0019D5765B|nr:recombinase family protein [Bifidobacterium dentium]